MRKVRAMTSKWPQVSAEEIDTWREQVWKLLREPRNASVARAVAGGSMALWTAVDELVERGYDVPPHPAFRARS